MKIPKLIATALILGSFPAIATAQDPFARGSKRAVRDAYLTYFAPAMPAMGFTGSVAGCIAGTISPAFKQFTIGRINYFRRMAGVPGDVTLDSDATREGEQQSAAVLFAANQAAGHVPVNPPFSACTSLLPAASNAAAISSVASSATDDVIPLYMDDAGSGNEAVPDRRWILYRVQPSVAVGAAPVGAMSGGSAVRTFRDRSGRDADQYGSAWPAGGYVPIQVLPASNRWSYSLGDFYSWRFDFATVSMTANGVPIGVTVLSNNDTSAGDNTIVFVPQTTIVAGSRYTVKIDGISGRGTISTTYTVRPFDASLPIPAPGADFNGNGMSDLLWTHADGRAAIWMMDGFSTVDGGEIINAGTGWSVTHLADFNGDGKSDIVWRHTDGRTAIYLMDGRVPTTTQQIFNAGDGWTVTHAPDLNGDGKADLLFRHTDGRIAAWLMDGTTMIAGDTLRGAGTGWSVAQVGDIDGDGADDLVMAHTDGRYEVWIMNGLTKVRSYAVMNAGVGWTLTHLGDFDGDGTKDFVWRYVQGRAAIWLSPNSDGPNLVGDNSGWKVKHIGDFNGDGASDVYFEHDDGRAAIWLMKGFNVLGTAQILNAGTGWSAKALADLNGDGKADILWQHTDGRVAAWLMNGTTLVDGLEILGPGSGWGIASAEASNQGASDCPALPSNVVMLPDLQAINVPLLVLLPQGVIGATKVPHLSGNRISGILMSGETSAAYTPNPAVMTMAFSKCPGDLSYHTQQIDPTYGDVCYLRAMNLNYNELMWTTSTGAIVPPGMCRLPEAGGPWYINVRYEHNGCAYGAPSCGTALQWGNGLY
ncbi:hypothetical protein BWI17_14605 [Betaproteobacteria bacterium GR16-43]|nr:hypothetical protein BWI17_14605 [Betaproteobacteria bacterium GR16-43]